MKLRVKALSILVAVMAMGTVLATPAYADFFECAGSGGDSVSRDVPGRAPGSVVSVMVCYAPARQTYMYRGIVTRPQNGDVLRIGYTPYYSKGWVEHSYRSAPHDLDRFGNMPGEWYLSGDHGRDLQACLDPNGDASRRICTWP
ncbi:hypothetical protein [Pseudonocardia sp. GCM10023141]|uniref:hypothetical protein n=1 Tax=Pseudonocardia sp. GCM10023141 TaxID=3252653 RepID=UPI00361BEFE5